MEWSRSIPKDMFIRATQPMAITMVIMTDGDNTKDVLGIAPISININSASITPDFIRITSSITKDATARVKRIILSKFIYYII